MTEMYLASVERALAQPGIWVEIPRTFKTEFNARITGSCLEGGYLRVEPRDGDTPKIVSGKRYIATAGPVMTRVERRDGEWILRVQIPHG